MVAKAGLDRESVVRAAAALVDEEGVDALTLAKLAARLGVRTPSLYNHVESLGSLRRDLAVYGDHELSKYLRRATIGKARADAILALAGSYRDFARAHPGLYAATLRAPDPGDPELQAIAQDLVAIVLAVLAPYGLDGEDALHAVRALRSVMHGFISLEAGGGFGLPLDLNESFHRLIMMFVHGLGT